MSERKPRLKWKREGDEWVVPCSAPRVKKVDDVYVYFNVMRPTEYVIGHDLEAAQLAAEDALEERLGPVMTRLGWVKDTEGRPRGSGWREAMPAPSAEQQDAIQDDSLKAIRINQT